MTFFVEGLSNHQASELKVRSIGKYDTVGEAIAVAKRVIDIFLRQEFKAGMLPKALFAEYQNRGEYPLIFRDDDKTFNVSEFSHFHYAMARSAEICGGKK